MIEEARYVKIVCVCASSVEEFVSEAGRLLCCDNCGREYQVVVVEKKDP